MTHWEFFVESRDYGFQKDLFIRCETGREEYSLVKPLVMERMEFGGPETPTISTAGMGDRNAVIGFLQGALDAAWKLGLRPAAFADHTNELTAVRYHLEDMRALAKVPERKGS